MLVRLVTTPSVIRSTWIPPIGIAQLAGSLRAHQIAVHCLDLNPDDEYGDWIPTQLLGDPSEINGARRLIEEHSEKVEDWVRKVLEDGPDLVGVSIFHHGMLVPSIALAMGIHRSRPDLTVVFGGTFAVESNWQQVQNILDSGFVDGVVRGEGEVALVQIVRAIQQGSSLSEVPEVWSRQDDKIVFSATASILDIDELAIADFSDFNMDRYEGAWHGWFPIFGSRGCVNRCTFCNSRKMATRFRQRSTNHIMNEIKRNVTQYNVSDSRSPTI